MSYDKNKLLNLGHGMHIAERILDILQISLESLTAEDIAYGDSTVADMIVEIEEKLKEGGFDIDVATDEEVEEALDDVFGNYMPASTATVMTLEALAAAIEDENIKRIILGADIIGEENQVLYLDNGQTKALYLSGYTLGCAAPFTNNEFAITVCVANNSVLNIYGSNGGTVDGGSVDYDNCAVCVENGGTVNIYGGSFICGSEGDSNSSNVLYAIDGDINVYGGYFENPQFVDIQDNYCVMNIKNNSGSHITCYGGEFLDQNPADGDDKDTATGSTFVAEGYTVVESEKDGHPLYTVTKIIS